jgi:type II secretory pathway pseudopilin PulG
MVVVVIVGVLAAVAIVALREKSGTTPAEYAQLTIAAIEDMRTRATSRARWQRLEVAATGITHLEADAPGMGYPPTDWQVVRYLPKPASVVIHAYESSTRVVDGSDPGATGLPTTLDFAPDATGAGGTIFFTSQDGRQVSRVAIYPVTGLAYLFEGF